MPSRFDRIASHPAVLFVLWGGAVLLGVLFGDHYWIPLDDGTLAQAAERVLSGELPHRDFHDPYTGFNAVLGALAFKLFGVELSSLRIPLVVGFAAWLPAVWLVTRRFAAPGAALAATALAATMSVPAYPAAMPTWFALFSVTWGVWAALRWMETDRRGWLLAAGAMAGVAVLFKVVGLYFLAALLLTAAFRRPDGSTAYFAVAVAGVGVFLLMVARLVLPSGGTATTVHFFLPAAVLGAAVVGRSRPGRAVLGAGLSSSLSAPGGGERTGVGSLVADAVVAKLGAALPVLLFLLPYLFSGSVGAWVDGVFLRPVGRLGGGASSPPGDLSTLVPAFLAVGVVALTHVLASEMRRGWALAVAAGLAALLAFESALGVDAFSLFWYSARGWVPALAVWAAWRVRRPEAFLLAATAALWALVQFPWSAPAYLFYIAPLGVLATLAVAAPQRRRSEREAQLSGYAPGARPPLPSAAVLVVFACLYGYLGAGYVSGVVLSATTPLELERGGILVAEGEAAEYERLVTVIRERLNGGTLWAGPDAPEVYFLAGADNPTRVMYEFLSGRAGGAAKAGAWPDLASLNPRVVVFNTEPLFSPRAPEALRAEAARMLPDSTRVGRFVVRWREGPVEDPAQEAPAAGTGPP